MKTSNILGSIGLGLVAKKLATKVLSQNQLKDKIVLITGGSTGLGLVLAEHLIKENCKIAICARDKEDLDKAQKHLKELKGNIYSHVCDVAKEEEVQDLMNKVMAHFGSIDIVINNAGIIQVGPMETFSRDQYQKAMDIMYWGIVNTTFAVLPYMKEKRQGQIINITSVGGKVSVPHLLPYNAAKFAAVGFSEGITAELKKDNIHVTTIVPWLMRTGSYVNAFFQEGNKKEFKLFSLMSSLPFLTVDADRAAKKIITAIKEKRPFKVIGSQARMAMEVEHFFPSLTARVFGLVSRNIPGKAEEQSLEKGQEFLDRNENAEAPIARKFGEQARRDHQELR